MINKNIKSIKKWIKEHNPEINLDKELREDLKILKGEGKLKDKFRKIREIKS